MTAPIVIGCRYLEVHLRAVLDGPDLHRRCTREHIAALRTLWHLTWAISVTSQLDGGIGDAEVPQESRRATDPGSREKDSAPPPMPVAELQRGVTARDPRRSSRAAAG